MTHASIVSAVQSALSPDLLKPEWRRIARRRRCPVTGHCYAASEAIFHMLGGADQGWVPQVLSHRTWPEGLRKGQTHWFLKNRLTGAVIDAASAQFVPLVPKHDGGVGSGFLTRSPSRRAAEIISRVAA
ncbi:hypothetical protein [Rhizobium leguminosarum]|uniref:hypothetical protein n=1 Tax=Rhizobium leguminosarum TaxID=384 RepID=UPI002E139329|nr:hypothetical protein U8Q02_37775 [Rhizobium leguminosarum]